MNVEVGLRVSGVDWDDPEVEQVMVEKFSDTYLAGVDPAVLNISVEDSAAVAETVQIARKLLCALPGLKIDGVDRDLVNVSDIAHRVGMTREGARKWTQSDTFPTAFSYLGSSSMSVWTWTEVVLWLRTERSLELDDQLPTIEVLTQIENCLMGNPDNTSVQWNALPPMGYYQAVKAVRTVEFSGAGRVQRSTSYASGLVDMVS
ncbi:MAG: hypothetical protein QM774_11195 [Gordonia sp. (in: high G+C Gram-positive bacteria)]|uniref:hypothetical protein n=1 Tax=Gordonia sp. (in: high G+C Gram-positive bacteria) TaxID=84139 RepID=UPI0039E301FB